ncbi:hypothetical protein GGS26DRAFT_505660 [Hypomontagnella submonticulosa]|nr:hypothetical protein GGS26DRAFT_505660 [Hypomontagnella submonticulosa]
MPPIPSDTKGKRPQRDSNPATYVKRSLTTTDDETPPVKKSRKTDNKSDDDQHQVLQKHLELITDKVQDTTSKLQDSKTRLNQFIDETISQLRDVAIMISGNTWALYVAGKALEKLEAENTRLRARIEVLEAGPDVD